jgi:VanZ family protein
VKPAAPVIALVLFLTAFPVELRTLNTAEVSWTSNLPDALANVVGFVPVGMVLAKLRRWHAVAIAGLLSLAAETLQLLMAHRYSSPVDLLTNTSGAIIGWHLAGWLRCRSAVVPLNKRTAGLAAFLLFVLLAVRGWSDWIALSMNSRGALVPGTLEAHWTFDNCVENSVLDSSANGNTGLLIGGTKLTTGIRGLAASFDGDDDHVDFGSPVQLRLMGSMTICAWINSAWFPTDDAAIVSAHLPGYQLDTTFDCGLRTIGFKLVDPCGVLMARYGATELARDTWYHVAGVYDADARTIHVYLDGQPDDGLLTGQVAAAQRVSYEAVFVGRRSDREGYEFAGMIDDVRLYSRPLSAAQISSVMNGADAGDHSSASAGHALPIHVLKERVSERANRCDQPTMDRDAVLPGLIVASGMLSAFACAGFCPERRLAALIVSLLVGLLVLPAAALTLPSHVLWMIPSLSLVGGASIALSIVKETR